MFLTPDAVLAIIEVKSSTDGRTLDSVLDKFSELGRKLGSYRPQCLFALFSYESAVRSDRALEALREKCDHETKIVDLISLGCSTFVKWWKFKPTGSSNEHYERWHSYHLENMSAGYFIANVVEFVNPDSVGGNDWLLFPEEGKESKKTGDIVFAHALNPAGNAPNLN